MEYIESILSELSHELFLYPWEFFELRIQEEMVRADRSGIGFGYMEIHFDAMRKALKPEVNERTLWQSIFTVISESMRGSDVKGHIAGDGGIGLVFLDSTMQGVIEFRERLWVTLVEQGLVLPGQVPDNLKITRYPLETAL
jgi:hypothetical protein